MTLLYFAKQTAFVDSATGKEQYTNTLWASDGTVAGTQAVKDLNNATDSSDITDFTSFAGLLYFIDGNLLIRSDGTPSGTASVNGGLNSGEFIRPSALEPFQGSLYFGASAYLGDTYFLWRSDGTLAGSTNISALYGGGLNSVSEFANLNGELYFRSIHHGVDIVGHDNGIINVNLYKSDGTAAGTTDVALLSTNGADVPDITAFDGLIIYGHNNSLASDAQLYATDASGSSVLLKNFGFGRSPSNFTAVGSTLFFTAQDSDGDELWKTDGTASGTTLVEDIVPGSTGSNPTSLFDYDGVLYFSAATAGYGAELWRSDGTAAGTYMVKDLVAGATGSFPANFVTYNGRLYFSANGGIWSSDGTSEGTELAISGRSLLDPQVADGALYFLGSNGSTYGLYRSDGTAAGTVELADNVDPNSGFDVADLSAPNTHYYAYSGGQTISFADPSGDIASLYNSAGVWDTVFGSYGKIYLSNAQAKVIGAGDSLFATGSDNQVKLFSTSGHFDKVFGSDLIAYVVSAEASFIGGANSIRTSGTGNRLKLLSTGDEMDKVFGPNVNVNLASAQASFIGGGDVIRASGTGDVVKLFATFGQFDKVYGANVNAYLINAEASFTQGGDTIHLLNGQNDIVKLFATGANADMVIGSNSTIDVIGAQTKITGSNDKVALFDDDTVSLAGGSFQLLFQPAIGKDTINGFGSTDTMQFSAQDFADFAALQAHLSQSGANTVISLDAADTVTLTNVNMSSLSASQFKFV